MTHSGINLTSLLCIIFFILSCSDKKEIQNTSSDSASAAIFFYPDSSVYKIKSDEALRNGFIFKTNFPVHTRLELIRGDRKPAKRSPEENPQHDTIEINSTEISIPYDPKFDYVKILLKEKIQLPQNLADIKKQLTQLSFDTIGCSCLFQYTINVWTASQKKSYVDPHLQGQVDLFIK